MTTTNFGFEQPAAPSLVVRVGVTGHRPDGLARSGYDKDLLRDSIHQVLKHIRSTTDDVFARCKDSYGGEKPALRLISPLAEGSDRLVADIALDPTLGYSLHCALPFSRTDYIIDFKKNSALEFTDFLDRAEVVLELNGSADTDDTKKKAYVAVGDFLVRQCDVLVAVWDGEPGDIGGTGQVVEKAKARDIPIIWIDSRQPHRPSLWEAGSSSWIDITQLTQKLVALLEPPKEEEEVKSIERFVEKELPAWTVEVSWEPKKLFRWRIYLPHISIIKIQRSIGRALKGTWRTFAERIKPAETLLRQHFIKADYLAYFYANRYRNSLVFVYILGALTVLAAFLGFFTKEHAWTWFELSLFLAVVFLIFLGKNQYWHGRWIDYRVLAEGIWQARLLAVIGWATPSFHVPVRLDGKSAQSTWYNWYLRAVIRQAGFPSTHMDESYLKDFHSLVEEAIDSQISYHDKTIKGRHHLHHQLHRATEVLFWMAAFACLMHLAASLWHELEERIGTDYYHGIEFVLTFCVLVLPAFGAAISAILHQREFKWTVLRSSALKSQLESLRGQLKSIPDNRQEGLGATAHRFSDHALGELVDWHSVFLGKELSLP